MNLQSNSRFVQTPGDTTNIDSECRIWYFVDKQKSSGRHAKMCVISPLLKIMKFHAVGILNVGTH